MWKLITKVTRRADIRWQCSVKGFEIRGHFTVGFFIENFLGKNACLALGRYLMCFWPDRGYKPNLTRLSEDLVFADTQPLGGTFFTSSACRRWTWRRPASTTGSSCRSPSPASCPPVQSRIRVEGWPVSGTDSGNVRPSPTGPRPPGHAPGSLREQRSVCSSGKFSSTRPGCSSVPQLFRPDWRPEKNEYKFIYKNRQVYTNLIVRLSYLGL